MFGPTESISQFRLAETLNSINNVTMPGIKHNQSERSMDDDDMYTTTDGHLRNMKDVNLSDDDLSIPTSTFTSDLFSSTNDEDEEMEKGVRKLPSGRRPRSCCCICQRVVTPIVVVLFVTLFAIYYFGDSSMLEGIPGTDMMFASEDLGEQFVWRRSNTDGGLSLKIVNALDTQWHAYFDVAVSDWDNGAPDALTLSSEVASVPDPDCTMIDGLLKMCNKDYGRTDWMGVNEVLTFDEEITASIGMMNDYFFGSSLGDHAKRQYTMCHEMGHGFGLAHTDTTLWNRNTGNCLDYTNRPKKNMWPGQINYDRLAEAYGIVGNTTATKSNATTSGTTGNNGNSASSGNSNANTGNNQNGNNNNNGPNNNNEKNKDNADDRALSSSSSQSYRSIPSFVLEQLRQIREEYDTTSTTRNDPSTRRFLVASSSTSSSKHSESLEEHYEVDLGAGYTVNIQFLKAF